MKFSCLPQKEKKIKSTINIPIDQYLKSKIIKTGETPTTNQNLNQQVPITKFQNFTHLIVDDSETNREVLNLFLKRIGIKTDEASNGKEAIEMISKNNYHIVWMDINMPVMNGIQCVKILRKNNYKGIIIALTGNVEKIVIENCYQVGMNDFISKPISKEELIAKIYKYS